MRQAPTMPSSRFLFLRRPRAEDALALVITGLEVLKDSSDTISVVPFLGTMISAGLGLANTVQVRWPIVRSA